MPSIRIDTIPSACQNATSFSGQVFYKLSTDVSYIFHSNIILNSNGSLSVPIIINNLLTGNCYDTRVVTSCGEYNQQHCIEAITPTTTTTTSTSSTSTTFTSSTTSTTTINLCSLQGFEGKVYYKIAHFGGYEDKTIQQLCSGNLVNLPAEDKHYWIVFFEDAACTIPKTTYLNNTSIIVNGVPNFIGDGSPQLAYYIGSYPYFYSTLGQTCDDIETIYVSTPVITLGSCILNPINPNLLEPGTLTLVRGMDDNPIFTYEAIYQDIYSDEGGIGTPGYPGISFFPTSSMSNSTTGTAYGTITIHIQLPRHMWGGIISVTGWTINGLITETLEYNLSQGFRTTSNKFLLDINHPVIVKVDEWL